MSLLIFPPLLPNETDADQLGVNLQDGVEKLSGTIIDPRTYMELRVNHQWVFGGPLWPGFMQRAREHPGTLFTIANTLGTMWHVSTGRGLQTGHSATHSLYFGQGESSGGGGNYNTGAQVAGTVTSPSIALLAGSAVSLDFNYVLQTEGSVAYDQAKVQISTDGGSTFTTLKNLSATAESSPEPTL